MAVSLDELEARCREVGLSCEVRTAPDGEEPGQLRLLGRRHALIRMPEGRDHVELRINEGPHCDLVAGSRFEFYRRLPRYEAVWSEVLGIVECGISLPLSFRGSPSYALRRLAGVDGVITAAANDADWPILTLPSPDTGLSMCICMNSLEFAVLRDDRAIYARETYREITQGQSFRPRQLVLRVSGAHIRRAETVIDLLERLGAAMLFQLDLFGATPLALEATRHRERGRPRPSHPHENGAIRPPGFYYDSSAMALYWYAQSVSELPLVQFLAFYQILEFYFATYSTRATLDDLRGALKDPRFNMNSDTQLTKLLSRIRPATRGWGDERAQMRATVRGCVTPEDVQEFLERDPDRKDYFCNKKLWAKLSNVQVDGGDEALVEAVGSRIYQVRCRIVHAGESSDSADNLGPLMPFSIETRKYLRFEIDLARFVAIQVLIKSSRALEVPPKWLRENETE